MHHKKFALAAKFFEYIFEPLIAAANSIFYTIKFHRFISSLLYFWLATKEEPAEQLFKDFAAMMRSLDGNKVASFFPEQGLVQQVTATPISQIATFCLIHRKTIGSEVDALRGDDQNWILDLTTAAMMSTLACWAETMHDLDVYCDNSKPIQAQADVFQHLVNCKDRTRMSIAGRERLITFNLVQPITMVDSASTPGIQLADVIASSFAYALNHPDDTEAQQWKQSLKGRLTDDNVWYDRQDVDLTAREPFVNAVVLSELVDRSVRKANLLDGLERVIATAYRTYPEYQRSLPKQTRKKR